MAAAPRLEAREEGLNPRTIRVDPLRPVVGAKINGIDLSKPLSAEQPARLDPWHAAQGITRDAEVVIGAAGRNGIPDGGASA